MADDQVIETPKSKEEMRHEPHAYVDASGWCAVCGRSEGWKAHDEHVATTVDDSLPDDDDAYTADEPSTDDMTTGPLDFSSVDE